MISFELTLHQRGASTAINHISVDIWLRVITFLLWEGVRAYKGVASVTNAAKVNT